jgi:hypothetical protein
MKQPNTVFLHMFNWFIMKYWHTTTKDCKENWQRMAATWHPSKGSEPLATHLFISASYTSAARYPMDDHDDIYIGLCIIKRCAMYAKEYKNWILRKNVVPAIVKTIDSFKEYWASMVALVNQTAVPALQHGYNMTAMDGNALVTLYRDLLANFGTVFAATQETMKSQSNSLVAMQNQLANIQLCMTVRQKPPSSGYTPAQQQRTFTNHNKRNSGGQSNGRGFPQQLTMNYSGTGGDQQQVVCPPTPYKRWGNGTTVTSTGVIMTTITPVQLVANQVLCTTLTPAAQASWADWLPECTRQFCPRLPPALHPIFAPSSSSTLSNIRSLPTIHLEARLGSNQPLPCSNVECHRPMAPTASR